MPHEILQTARGNIPYTLFPQFSRSYSPEGNSEIVQHISVDWDKVWQFERAILADAEVGDTYGTVELSDYDHATPNTYVWKKLKRYLPEPHPILTSHFAHKLEIAEGIGYITTNTTRPEFRVDPMSATMKYGKARVIVTYRWLPYNATLTDTDIYTVSPLVMTEMRRYVSVKIKGSGQNLPLRGQPLSWVASTGLSEGAPIPEVLAVPVTKANLVFTWHMVPEVNAATFLLMGKTNEYPIPNYFWDLFPNLLDPGKILYVEPEISPPYPTISERRVVDISFHCTFRPQGHNQFLRGSTGRFQRGYRFPTPAPYVDPNNAPAPAPGNVYNYADLNNLFRIH